MFSKIFTIAILLTLSFSAFGQSLSHSQGEEYTAEQKAKLNQAEELADKFVQRWHETLDFKTVFDEYFVTSPEYRKQNYYLFSKPESCKSCDEDMIRDGYFAYHNALARRQELALAYGTTDNGDCRCPLKFLGASKLLERSFEGTISPDKDLEFKK